MTGQRTARTRGRLRTGRRSAGPGWARLHRRTRRHRRSGRTGSGRARGSLRCIAGSAAYKNGRRRNGTRRSGSRGRLRPRRPRNACSWRNQRLTRTRKNLAGTRRGRLHRTRRSHRHGRRFRGGRFRRFHGRLHRNRRGNRAARGQRRAQRSNRLRRNGRSSRFSRVALRFSRSRRRGPRDRRHLRNRRHGSHGRTQEGRTRCGRSLRGRRSRGNRSGSRRSNRRYGSRRRHRGGRRRSGTRRRRRGDHRGQRRIGLRFVFMIPAQVGVRIVFHPVADDRRIVPHVVTDQKSKIVVDRTGVGFLVLNAQRGERINNRARLDFKLPCQFVNSDLTHRWRKNIDAPRAYQPRRQRSIRMSVTAPSAMVTDSLPAG